MCIAIVCFPGYDVIDFEINLIFLIEPFSYITRESTQKFIYLDNKKSDEAEIKTFIIFKGLSVANNCLRPENTHGGNGIMKPQLVVRTIIRNRHNTIFKNSCIE